MRFVLAMLAAAFLAAASAACSGDGNSDEAATTEAATTATAAAETTTTTTVPETFPDARPEPSDDQSRWARQVDAVCRPWQERIDAVPAPTDAASLEAWVARTLPLLRGQVAAVDSVRPTSGGEDARRSELFIASLERLERAFRRFRAAIRAQDVAEIQASLAQAAAAGAAARRHALSLGITECGGYSQG